MKTACLQLICSASAGLLLIGPPRPTLQLDRLPPQICQSIQLRALLLQRLRGRFLSLRCQPFQNSFLCALLRPLRLQHDSMFGGPTRLQEQRSCASPRPARQQNAQALS